MIAACRMNSHDADGKWRITSFSGKPVFVGDALH
jgi:hypothetical protein